MKPGPAVKARCCFCGVVHDSEECPDDRAAGYPALETARARIRATLPTMRTMIEALP